MKKIILVLLCVVIVFGAGNIALAKFAADSDRAGNYTADSNDTTVEYQDPAGAGNDGSKDNESGSDSSTEQPGSDNGSESQPDKSANASIFNFSISQDDLNAILMDKKAASLDSKTNYLALVNCTTHRVGIYEGSADNWTRVKYYECGDGKPETPTIHGDFETGPQTAASHTYKLPYFDSEGARCWYATRINGPYLFHSVLYKVASQPNEIEDGRVGEAVSHGCIRLELENAKWIYDTLPELTRVIIYTEDEE